jgi:hypothetical protein
MAEQWPDEELTPSTDADVPFGGGPDFEVDEAIAPEGADAAAADQGKFMKPPPGPNVFVVDRILEVVDDGGPVKTIDPRTGRDVIDHMETPKVSLRMALKSNRKASLILTLFLPPRDPAKMVFYWFGVGKKGKNKDGDWKKQPGYNAHVFRMFVDRLFYDAGGWPEKKPQPVMSRKSENWLGREIIATVDPPRPWTGDDGKEREGDFQFDLHSFQPATPENIKALEAAKAGQAGVATPNTRSMPAPATKPVSSSQPRGAARPAATRQAVQDFDIPADKGGIAL